MEINFKYLSELGLFIQLLFLGGVLCTLVMYITEAAKIWLKAFKFCSQNTWTISVICFIISMGFAIGWKTTFAPDTINWGSAIWLGVLLYLGSTGLYTKLENSSGFWGKTVQSYSKYINSDEIVSSVLTAAQKEAAQVEESKK